MKAGEILESNLHEAYQEIGKIVAKLRADNGEIDEMELKADLSEALWHLCAAWNGRHLSFDEVNQLDPDQFRSLGERPNLD